LTYTKRTILLKNLKI